MQTSLGHDIFARLSNNDWLLGSNRRMTAWKHVYRNGFIFKFSWNYKLVKCIYMFINIFAWCRTVYFIILFARRFIVQFLAWNRISVKILVYMHSGMRLRATANSVPSVRKRMRIKPFWKRSIIFVNDWINLLVLLRDAGNFNTGIRLHFVMSAIKIIMMGSERHAFIIRFQEAEPIAEEN